MLDNCLDICLAQDPIIRFLLQASECIVDLNPLNLPDARVALHQPTHLVRLMFLRVACVLPASVNPTYSLIAPGAFGGKSCMETYTFAWKQCHRLKHIQRVVKVDIFLKKIFIAKLLSDHKISVQLMALFGLVQPYVPLVACMVPVGTQTSEEIEGRVKQEGTRSLEIIDLLNDADTCLILC